MKLRHKILLGASLLAVLPVLATGGLISFLSTELAERSLVEQSREQLTTIRELKGEQIEDYFRIVRGELQTESARGSVVTALRELSAAAAELDGTLDPAGPVPESVAGFYRDDAVRLARERTGQEVDNESLLAGLDPLAAALQQSYLVANPSPVGFKDELTSAGESAYDLAHARHHPDLRDIVRASGDSAGYTDVLLIDGDSARVVYSSAKALDFGVSLEAEAYADTALGRAFRRAWDAASTEDVVFADFAAYRPGYGSPSALIASPVAAGGERVGVMVLRFPPNRIDAIMSSAEAWRQAGLRETGETYLVGADGTMRNDSRFLVEAREDYLSALGEAGVDGDTVRRIGESGSSVLLQPVRTDSVEAAFAGRTGFQRDTDYRGESVFAAYAPLRVQGLNWAIVAQFDEAEALAPVAELRTSVLGGSAAVGLVVLALGGGAGWAFTRTVTRPVRHLEDTVRRISAGDDEARARMTTGDEMQTLGDAFDELLDERIRRYEEAQRENERLNNSVIELLKAVHELSQHDLTVKVPVTEDVTGPVADALNQMVSEVGELLQEASGVAEQVGTASARLKRQAEAVKEMAGREGEEVDAMTAELEAAAQTMSQIAELAERCDRIAAQASETTGTALETVNGTVQGMGVIRELVHETEKRIKRLGERSQEISGAVDLINTIAERTHVLALNAAMQAAAAGEAGRGFAVVADEVQRLAESSRNATSQISGLVHNIQVETADTITTMGRTISEVVEGSRLAEQAGQEMARTRETTGELVAAVQEIAGDSRRQVEGSTSLRRRAASVQLSTRNTRERLDEQTRQTGVLANSAGSLLTAIRAFRLPGSEGEPAGETYEQAEAATPTVRTVGGGEQQRGS
ncbi:methyl-accepting chemotaxis protein [Spiribacter halobius]|uniref:Methyl-accepting chemotaxis protein n=1 Tax=Sediminicurvatus halobius TaxID=2182432 RepID=A0A2U2MWE4_9GAMM|nr:methyl-accepting chemotaxis protein [Spiribacter halobius]PWG61106.1 hypothetical protein DEM34_18080 [Spiribacter halobius]UEX77075.1 methyl-accepting chemotaxis protein [Spiribacter halobius]